MPELAEVEYYRKRWDPGLKRRVVAVELHPQTRVFRGVPVKDLQAALTGSTFIQSAANGKQLLFQFSKGGWLGIHLGMTGKLRVDEPAVRPGKHDHLVLRQRGHSLIFSDPRQFGRVLFHQGGEGPGWWTRLPAAIGSRGFTLARMDTFLLRHGRAPIKAVLLLQRGFPGIGNWMADEILWRAGIHPARETRSLSAEERKRLYRETRAVCGAALQTIGRDYSDPPKNWLIHRRWRRGGHCPREDAPLQHKTIAGRTTCWCPVCQPQPGRPRAKS